MATEDWQVATEDWQKCQVASNWKPGGGVGSGCAGLLLLNPSQEWLCLVTRKVKPGGRDRAATEAEWELPKGGCKASDASPWDNALREFAEETDMSPNYVRRIPRTPLCWVLKRGPIIVYGA